MAWYSMGGYLYSECGMVDDWLEPSACNVERTGVSLTQDGYCVIVTLSKSFKHSCLAVGTSEVLLYGGVCTFDIWKDGNIRYSCWSPI